MYDSLRAMYHKPVGIELILGGGLKRGASEARKGEGPGGLPQGKFFMTTPFRSLEKAPTLENVPLSEARITTIESLSIENLKF